MKRSERTEAMIERAREVAAQGRRYQTIELLLVMEGFAEASELLSQDLIGELRRTAEAARKDSRQNRMAATEQILPSRSKAARSCRCETAATADTSKGASMMTCASSQILADQTPDGTGKQSNISCRCSARRFGFGRPASDAQSNPHELRSNRPMR
jgi:hypothetical protein